MNIDDLTTYGTIWAAFTVVLVLAVAYCKGCCIAKMLGKPCPRK